LGQLIERAETARHHDESVRVFEEQYFSHEKVVARHPPIEVPVWRLLERKFDVAADGESAGVFRAAVGGFHQSRSAAGHHRETKAADAASDFARDRVVRMRLAETRRSENRDTRADKMQRAKAADEIAHRAPEQNDFAHARMRSFKQHAIGLARI